MKVRARWRPIAMGYMSATGVPEWREKVSDYRYFPGLGLRFVYVVLPKFEASTEYIGCWGPARGLIAGLGNSGD